MPNIVIAKKDMAGRVMIGNGWLVCRTFAVLVRDDPRFQSVVTALAAFKDFHPETLDDPTFDAIDVKYNELATDKAGVGLGEYLRTRVLVEDQESGELLRAYRNLDAQEHYLVPERTLQILGKPVSLRLSVGSDVLVCEAGISSINTEIVPGWAAGLADE